MTTDHDDLKTEPFVVNIDCEKKMNDPRPGKKWDKCMCQQLCAKIKKMDEARKAKKIHPVPGARTSADYATYKRKFITAFMQRVKDKKGIRRQFIHPCAADKYEKEVHPGNPTTQNDDGVSPFNADHMHEAALGCDLKDLSNFKMMDSRVNTTISFEAYKPDGKHKDQPIKAHATCNCPDGPE